MPERAGFRFGGESLPAQEVGGDCFDFIDMDRDGDGGIGILLADASGHGIGPALLTTETRAYLHALTMTCADVGRVLTLTNKRLSAEVFGGHFVTLFLARLDPRASPSSIPARGTAPDTSSIHKATSRRCSPVSACLWGSTNEQNTRSLLPSS